MTDVKRKTAERFLINQKKNLIFFRENFPEISRRLENLLLEHTELLVSPVEPDVDLQVFGQSWYGGKASQKAKEEVDQFLRNYPSGHMLRTFPPAWKSSFGYPGFAAKKISHCLAASPLEPNSFSGYPVPVDKNFPLVVFLGVGLGYQIETLINRVNINNAIIYESDPEVLLVSFYTVDWGELATTFRNRGGESFSFVLGAPDQFEKNCVLLERQLTWRSPLHPFLTVFLNHRGQEETRKMGERVRKDVPRYFANLNNYDDEVRRLNNAIHNVRHGLCYLPPAGEDVQIEKPVLIVGSGPSIDERMSSIKSVRDKVIIVTCGTGLRGILKAGLKPDFHVEIDPDYNIYQLLQGLGENQLCGITLLASAEVNPLVATLFDQAYLYYRSDHSLCSLFDVHHRAFPSCAPTCTNAALSIFVNLGFNNLFLFGTDYGFKEREKHHSSGSIYGSPDDSEVSNRLGKAAKSAFIEGQLIEDEGVNGGKVFTRPDYYSAKRQVENFVSEFTGKRARLKLHNCSDGAVIQGVPWMGQDAFVDQVTELTLNKEELVALSILDAAVLMPQDHVTNRVEALVNEVRKSCDRRRRVLSQGRLRGKRDVVKLVSRIARDIYVIQGIRGFSSASGSQMEAHALLWASMVQWLGACLLHGVAYQGASTTLSEYLELWRKCFDDFLKALPEHLANTVLEERSLYEDPMVFQSLTAT